VVALADELLADAVLHLQRVIGSLEPWQRDAACREHPGVDYFPPRGAPTGPARAVCANCLVTGECLAYALEHNIKHGVWGGLSERERRRLRRDRAIARRAELVA
jgi:WhiB family redox-sensing transcriptional regulator